MPLHPWMLWIFLFLCYPLAALGGQDVCMDFINGESRNCCPKDGYCQDSSCKVFGFPISAHVSCQTGSHSNCSSSYCKFKQPNCVPHDKMAGPKSNKHCYGTVDCNDATMDCYGYGEWCLEDGNSYTFKICTGDRHLSPSESLPPSESSIPLFLESPEEEKPSASDSHSPSPSESHSPSPSQLPNLSPSESHSSSPLDSQSPSSIESDTLLVPYSFNSFVACAPRQRTYSLTSTAQKDIGTVTFAIQDNDVCFDIKLSEQFTLTGIHIFVRRGLMPPPTIDGVDPALDEFTFRATLFSDTHHMAACIPMAQVYGNFICGPLSFAVHVDTGREVAWSAGDDCVGFANNQAQYCTTNPVCCDLNCEYDYGSCDCPAESNQGTMKGSRTDSSGLSCPESILLDCSCGAHPLLSKFASQQVADLAAAGAYSQQQSSSHWRGAVWSGLLWLIAGIALFAFGAMRYWSYPAEETPRFPSEDIETAGIAAAVKTEFSI